MPAPSAEEATPDAKIMLVNVTHVEESRVAVLNDGVLEAYEIETLNRAQIKGNIYNAVVENVHPSLEAAFLKISPELKGFLPLDEVNFNLLPTRSEKSQGVAASASTCRRARRSWPRSCASLSPASRPSVSTYFSLPGRYLVLMPGVDSAGISRKIEDSAQRDRLKKILEELRPPEGFGLDRAHRGPGPDQGRVAAGHALPAAAVAVDPARVGRDRLSPAWSTARPTW